MIIKFGSFEFMRNMRFMVESFVRNIMKFNVVLINSSSNVLGATKMVKDASIGCVIVTENNTAVRIITERDLVHKILTLQKPLSTFVKDIMSTPLIMIDPEETHGNLQR